MTIVEWSTEHEDVIVSIGKPKTDIGYKTDILLEDIGQRGSIRRELVGMDPATEDEICIELYSMYEALKEIIR